MKAPSQIPLIAAIVIGIGAMITFNNMSQKITPKSDEELEQEQQKAAQDAAAKAGTPKPAATTAPGPSDDLVSYGQDSSLGVMTASAPEVTVRWSWTPAVQNDPNKVNATIKALEKAVPTGRVHIINTDETPDAPNGVFVGSQMIAPAAPDGSINVDPKAVIKALGK